MCLSVGCAGLTRGDCGDQLPDWRERESAILALGAISEGCAEGLQPYIPSMVEMLLPKVSDPRPLVRSISCWALSRYSSWVVRASTDGGPDQQQFHAVLQVRAHHAFVTC